MMILADIIIGLSAAIGKNRTATPLVVLPEMDGAFRERRSADAV